MTNTLDKTRAGKVFVGMSGGVDSSVAALLLKKSGFDVVGVHLRSWNKGGCDVPEAEDARRVADKLNIPFYVLDMEKEYKERVVDYMIDGYRNGITPNPDVMCNKEIKFGLFLEKALSLGAEYIATGHYVRMEARHVANRKSPINESSHLSPITYHLSIARDANKDQSYFLWTLTQEQLKHSLFPLGDLTKSEVRRIARDAGLPTAEKKDSQGICFIGKVTLKEFLGEYLEKKEGYAVSPDGKILGRHDGAHFYTIGQRHGLGIGGGEPYYVAEKNVETNTVTLATREEPKLSQKETTITDVNFILPTTHHSLPAEVYVRVRYRQQLKKAKLFAAEHGNYKLVFEDPVEFVAPGQSAVFYSTEGGAGRGASIDRKMLGGGIIV